MIDRDRPLCEFPIDEEHKEKANYQIRLWVVHPGYKEGHWSNWISVCARHFKDYQAEEAKED